jgi:hypothetical protein
LTLCISLNWISPVLACYDPIKRSQKENTKEEEQDEPNMDGVVEVSFKIDNEGKVQILNMNSTSPQLAEYVIKKLNKIQLQQGDSQVGKIIRYRFVFKKQA